MTKQIELAEKREDLKGQLEAGKYQTLIDAGLDQTGDLIKKALHVQERPAHWYNAMIIALVTLLIGFSTSLLLGEFHAYRAEYGIVTVLFQLWLVGMAFVAVILLTKYCDTFFGTIHDKVIDAIESVADLEDFHQWLCRLQNLEKPLVLSLIYGLLVGLYVIIYYAAFGVGFVGFGPTILTVIVFFQVGMFLYYYVVLFFPFPVRLSRYYYRLNLTNPSSSEIIDHLSRLLNLLVLITALLLASLTFWLLGAAQFSLPNVVLLLLVGWGPLIALFVINQYSLARIINRGKWKKLNEVQEKIERIDAQEDIPSEKTLEHLTKLIDYYERIKATPNSALNLRAGLSFINSLLLPLLAFALGQMRDFF